MLGIGDGEARDPAIRQRCLEIGEAGVRLQRRAMRGEQHDAPDGIEFAAIDGPALIGEIEHEGFVGRHEHFEGRALGDLLPEIA